MISKQLLEIEALVDLALDWTLFLLRNGGPEQNSDLHEVQKALELTAQKIAHTKYVAYQVGNEPNISTAIAEFRNILEEGDATSKQFAAHGLRALKAEML